MEVIATYRAPKPQVILWMEVQLAREGQKWLYRRLLDGQPTVEVEITEEQARRILARLEEQKWEKV